MDQSATNKDIDTFIARVKAHREHPDPEMMFKELSLAVGFLLGAGMPGCAAALAVTTDKLFPGSMADYIGEENAS